MFALFLEFLTYLIRTLRTEALAERRMTVASVQRRVDSYLMLRRLYELFVQFATQLVTWQSGTYHGANWSACTRTLRAIEHVLALLGDDLLRLCACYEQQEAYRLRGQLRG